jgi:hypothetical protein
MGYVIAGLVLVVVGVVLYFVFKKKVDPVVAAVETKVVAAEQAVVNKVETLKTDATDLIKKL